MERKTGDLSFNPGHMNLGIILAKTDYSISEQKHSIWNLVNGSLIAQNILFACYNDRCTAEEISLKIGVAVPYLEKDLDKLWEKNVLIQKNGKYETNVVIFTKEYQEEADEKTMPVVKDTAEIIGKFLDERLADIKSIGFHTGALDDNMLKWQVAAMILVQGIIKYETSPNRIPPKKYPGLEGFLFGREDYESPYPKGGGYGEWDNANGDSIQYHGFVPGSTMDNHTYFHNETRINITADIAKGRTADLNENNSSEVAEFIRRGFAKKTGDKLSLTFPVFTWEQHKELLSLIEDMITVFAGQTQKFIQTATDILIQHTPVPLKKEAESMAWVNMDDIWGASLKTMMDNGILQPVPENNPAAYTLLVLA